MRIVETSVFTKRLKALASDEEYREFQNDLILNPTKGKIIRGSGGLRKIRIGTKSRGKSGGARIIYYYVSERQIILLLLIYEKSVQDALTNNQIKILKKLVEEEFK